MESIMAEAERQLRLHGQLHLLPQLDRLDESGKRELAAQIAEVDFDLLSGSLRHKAALTAVGGSIRPAPYEDPAAWTEEEREKLTRRGWSLLKEGKAGVIVVAGGQGSRLGYSGPKGTLDIGLPSGQSLFELQADRLQRLSAEAGRTVPWYVMTSPDNHEATVRFFERGGYFGCREEDIFFFEQPVMPSTDLDGRLLLESPSRLNQTPSGNGECFRALQRSGALEDMKRRGLEWLFYYNVDNALAKPADPVFLGLAASRGCPIATKAVRKRDPDEKLGLVCLKDGRPCVVEYTETPEAMLSERTVDGEPAYVLGSVSLHLFSRCFIESHAAAGLPYHLAVKKIPYIDGRGSRIMPESPNAYKLERFIYDFFPYADCMTVLKVEREEEFAPVKNKSGEDSPETARMLVLKSMDRHPNH